MKQHLQLLLLLLCSYFHGNSQILTPDFRYYTGCPNSPGQVDKCTGWVQPTGGTSDYFNVCASPDWVGVPQNYFGYQTSSANAYTGLYTFCRNAAPDYKEYIGTDFPALTVGRTYIMSITVSLADSSTHATNGLGVYFTTYPVNQNALVSTLPVTPQVDYSSYGVITDKIHWVTLSKAFVADSAYTHLVAGCFKPYGTMQIDSLSPDLPIRSGFSYYYIGSIGQPDSTRHASTDSLTPPGIDTTQTPPHEDSIVYGFPNAFTPNWDGYNDLFRISTGQGNILDGYSLSVFNLWGERVFFTENMTEGWDGTYKGRPQSFGVYCYYSEFRVKGQRQLLKGNVTLIR